MTVWFAVPSALPPERAMKCLSAWTARGYKVAVFRDTGAESLLVDLCLHADYPGYAQAVNTLAAAVLRLDPTCEWIVTGGDDVYPDAGTDPATIAEQCRCDFGGTLGVMQPTGDRHMVDTDGRCAAERVCISPWLGREWCERAHEGRGPLWPGYKWEYVDEDLHNVAKRLGLLRHRADLSHYHDWHGRKGEPPPAHMQGRQEWSNEGRRLFEQRRAAGFPHSGIL